MLGKVLKQTYFGIAYGCTFSCIVNIIGVSAMGNNWFSEAKRGYPAQVLAAMIVGIGWTVPALIYQNEKLSMSIKVLVHILIGWVVFLPCAFYMGWIAGSAWMVALELFCMIIGTFVIWGGFYLYHRNEAKKMNRRLKNLS